MAMAGQLLLEEYRRRRMPSAECSREKPKMMPQALT
jgi:hypothetical protein